MTHACLPRVPPSSSPPPHRSSNALSLLKALLIRDPSQRLGSGEGGAAAIKRHAFFRGIDWKKLEARELTSKFKPGVKCNMVGRGLGLRAAAGGESWRCVCVWGGEIRWVEARELTSKFKPGCHVQHGGWVSRGAGLRAAAGGGSWRCVCVCVWA